MSNGVIDDTTVDIDFGFDTDPAFAFDVGEEQQSGDYNRLVNKPQIESVVLQGNKPINTWVDGLTPQDIDDVLFG